MQIRWARGDRIAKRSLAFKVRGFQKRDTIGRVLALMNPTEFQESDHMAHRTGTRQERGKLRSGLQTHSPQRPVATRIRTSPTPCTLFPPGPPSTEVGQVQVDSKSNEIPAIGDARHRRREPSDRYRGRHQLPKRFTRKVVTTSVPSKTIIRSWRRLSKRISLNRTRWVCRAGHSLQDPQVERAWSRGGVCIIDCRFLTDAWPGATAIGQAITQSERNGACHFEVRYLAAVAVARDFASYVRDHSDRIDALGFGTLCFMRMRRIRERDGP